MTPIEKFLTFTLCIAIVQMLFALNYYIRGQKIQKRYENGRSIKHWALSVQCL